MIRIFKIFSYSVSKLFGYRFFNLSGYKKEPLLYINVENSDLWQKKIQFFELFFRSFLQLFYIQYFTRVKKAKKNALFICCKLHMFFLALIFHLKKREFLNEKILISFAFFIFFISANVLSSNSHKNNILTTNLINIADSFYQNGNFTASAKYYEELLKNEEILSNENKKYVFISLTQSYYYIGNYEKAIEYSNKTINDFYKINISSDENYYNCLIIKSQSFYHIGNYQLALENIEKAEESISKNILKNKEKAIFVFYHKAIIYYETGDYEKSLLYYEKSLRLLNNENKNYLSKIFNNIGSVYLKKEEYQKAKEYYQKSIAIKEEISPADLANSYNSYAIASKLSGEMKTAEKYYKKAILNRLKYNSGHPDLAKDYLNYGDFCMAINEYSKAISYYYKANRLFVNFYGQKNNLTSASLVAIADYYLKTKNTSNALKYYQSALISVCENFNIDDINFNPSITDVSSKLYLLKALKGKAQALSINGNDFADLNLSLKTYQLAIQLIGELSKAYISDESKMFLNENEKDTYVAAMEISKKLFNLSNKAEYISLAFNYAEKSKASALMANIRANEAIKYSKIPSFVQNIEQNIKTEIAGNEKILYSENFKTSKDIETINNLRNKIFELKQNQEKFYQFLDRNYSDYYNLKYKNQVTDIKVLQNNLKEKEAIIEYVLTENKLYSFLITNDYFTLKSQDINKDFFENIETVRNFSSKNTYGNSSLSDLNNYTSASYKLYEHLLKPFENIISWNHLILIPDKELNLISFETLLNKAIVCNDFNYSKLPYLIREHAISYSYSASLVFSKANTDLQSGSSRLLAFAPSYKPQTNINGQLAFNSRQNSNAALPYAKDETNGISKFFDGQILTDYNANKKNFINKLNNFDILHLAMHAELNDENPMYSRLIFSESAYGNNDGTLNTSDIYNMNIKSKLIVLSACNTGDGKIRNGEGVMSLARAFLYAGCPSVVMTLWSVEDRAGSELMISFYNYLAKGFTKDKALQLAKIDYLNNNPASKTHPYFWAAYVPIGDQRAVEKTAEDLSSIAYFVLIAGVGLGITPFFTNRKLKRKIYKVFRLRSKVFDC